MIIAALIVFGALLVAWLVAPSRESTLAEAADPELTVGPLPSAA